MMIKINKEGIYMFDNLKLGFIGFGNMGQAIATGLINQGAIQGNQIFACAKNWDKLCKNTQEKQINPCKSAKEVVDNVDMVIIAVKPYMIEEVITPIKKNYKKKSLFLLQQIFLLLNMNKFFYQIHII